MAQRLEPNRVTFGIDGLYRTRVGPPDFRRIGGRRDAEAIPMRP
jgi:hypothetical protein